MSVPGEPTGPRTRREARTGRLPRGGLAAAAGTDDFSFAQAVGGPRGVVEAVLPGLLFVVLFTVTRDLRMALVVAIGAAVLALLARVVTRASPAQTIGGLVGVVLCAVVAARTGQARDFFLPGFFINIGYATLYALSTISYPSLRIPGARVRARLAAWPVIGVLARVRTRPGAWPVIGLLVGPLTGEGLAWRGDPRRMRAYRQVTLMWTAMFLLRLAVQVPLYYAGLVGALGAARLAMGLPLFALTAYLTWLVLRAVPAVKPPAGQRVG